MFAFPTLHVLPLGAVDVVGTVTCVSVLDTVLGATRTRHTVALLFSDFRMSE